MKRRIIAALMALCLCIGLLPATALAVDTPSDSHYVTANYDTGALRRNITVNVYDERGTLVDTVSINDARVAAHRITISLTEQYASEYDIEDVSHPDSAGTFTNKNVSRDSCSFDTTGAEGSNMIVSVQLCPEFEPPEIVNEHDDWYDLTLEYRLYEPQMLELLYLNGDTDVNTKTTVSNIDVRFVDSYGILEDANLNSLPTGANNLPYRYMTLSDVGDKGNPNNIRYLEITYDNNDGSGEKTVRIYSGDLRYVGTEVDSRPVYEIEASDDSESIVAFYIEEGAELSTWSLYDVEFVKDGEALGYDRMPEDPTFPNTQYVFTNWDKNVTGGAPFLPYDPVTDHTVVYAQKTSTSGYGGTEYHAMNTGNALLDRFLELYNTNHNTEYGLNDIDLDSVKIQVNGLDSDATNPNYWNNHWKNNNAYYRIVNSTINLGWQSDTVSNTHVPHEQAQSITIYADVDGTSVEVVIPCGTNPGEIGKSLVQDNIVQLIVNAPPTAPDDEDLTDDPGDPDDTAILGEGAVTVDCINSKAEHDPVTYGLIPGSYTALTDEDVYWANDAEGNGAYYVDITVQDDLYVEAYNRDDDVDVTHRITGEDTKTITLKWVGSNWTVASVVPVTFTVTCDDEELPVYDITGIDKALVDSEEEKTAAEAAGIDVVDYNYPDAESGKVIIPKDDSVTLLYAITVEGKAGATFTVTDEDAELVEIDGVEIAVGTDTDGNATFSGSIPDGGSITFYVAKTFTAEDLTGDIGNQVLTNTAEITSEGGVEEGKDDDTEETPAEEEDPTKPDFDADDLAGVTVQVLCVQNPTGHTYKTTLKDAPSTAYKTSIESYEGSSSDWKCTVSINKDVFVGLFNSKAAEASWGTHAFSYATPDELVFYYTEASGWLCYGDPTFTISVTEQKSQYTVTFKVVNGTWSDKTSNNIVYTINEGTSLADNNISVPTDMKPNSGYTGGSWDTTPNTTRKLDGDVTYTYTFTKSGDTEPEDEDCILYFESNGGTEFKEIDNGNHSFRINPYSDSEYDQHIPSRPGYRFTGWYRDEDLENRISESTKINVNSIMTIYAGWERTSVPSMLNGDDHYAYIQGYADGTVRPNANITRAQVATIFFRLLDEDVRSDYLTTYNTFPDVNADYWANTAISTMASLGVINGRNSGLFDPDAYITRAEFAAICARFDDSNVSGFDSFTDTFGHWAEEEIGRAAALGWIQGYDDGTFRPNQYITRAQAVTMINRVLCRLPEDEDDLLPGMSVWTDCREGDWCYLAIQEATNSHDYVTKDRVYETWTDLNRDPDWSRYE